MATAKRASKRNRRSKAAVPVLGAAGLSLSLAGGASAQAARRRTQRRRISHQITKCFSVKRKSRTSVCRRSTSSTRNTPQRLRSVNKLPIGGGAAAAAAGVARADVAGDAVRAVAAAEAAAGPGAVAVGARLGGLPRPNLPEGINLCTVRKPSRRAGFLYPIAIACRCDVACQMTALSHLRNRHGKDGVAAASRAAHS